MTSEVGRRTIRRLLPWTNVGCSVFSLLCISAGPCGWSNRRSAIFGLNKSSDCKLRNCGPHVRSMAVRFDFKLAVEFMQSLAHSGETDTCLRASAKSGQLLSWYASPKIPYFQDYAFGLVLKTNAHLRSSGVTMHISQTLLQHPEEGGLDCHRQPLTAGRKIQVNANPAPLCEAIDIPLCSAGEAHFIEQGGCSRYDMVRISSIA
jgi:hypothetical protein